MNKAIALCWALGLLSVDASAVVTEQHWNNWYGNNGGMEFALSTQNQAGETLTLTCSGKKFIVGYSVPKDNYEISSDEGASDVSLIINNAQLGLDNFPSPPDGKVPATEAFNALKNTSASDIIRFTSFQSGDSKDFSANGLASALKKVSWEDCMNQ
ncbi:hypothetical protein [Yersinia intermedia]|uniref:hypothetical protein n=1 Tax=Yersinia intermedia TaxID=631 RepID=UPI0022FE47AF|nr:hypothetical protein [Yersinia intermedia]MDA5510808.1 hypothetical protein [Yersinia intermedia]